MKAYIRDVAYHLPVKEVTNEDLQRERPDWDLRRVAAHAGVRSRRIAGPAETAFDLAVEACRGLFARNPGLENSVDAVLFCTQSGDYIMPPNSCLLHREFGFPEGVFALDFNHACSGYVYGLSVARGLLASGQASNILLVTADTYSKYIHPGDRSTRTLFGDGAAATWVAGTGPGGGLIDLICATSGRHFDKFIIPAGGCRTPLSLRTQEEAKDQSGNVRTQEKIHMDGMGVLNFVTAKVPPQVRALLQRNSLAAADVDLFVFHQASKLALDTLEKSLKIPPNANFRNLERVGNLVSSSIPAALRDAMDRKRVSTGDTVVLCGFGVGLSWASALLKW